jgi:hypothetical protein
MIATVNAPVSYAFCSSIPPGNHLDHKHAVMVRNRKRRKAVVDARIQWMLDTPAVVHWLVFICCGTTLRLIVQHLSDPFTSPPEHVKTFGTEIASMFFVFLCLIPVFFRNMLTLSNRIVGPICRLRDTVKRMGDGGAVPPLTFRNNDMWNELPALFNTMAARLREPKTSALSDNEISVNAFFLTTLENS